MKATTTSPSESADPAKSSECTQNETATNKVSDTGTDINNLIDKECSTFTVIKEEISCWNWQLIIGGLIFCNGLFKLFSNFFFAIVLVVLGLGILSIGVTKYKEKQELQERELKRKIMAAVAKKSPSEEKTDSAPEKESAIDLPQPASSTLDAEEAEVSPNDTAFKETKPEAPVDLSEKNADETVVNAAPVSPKPSLKIKKYKVAGVTHYEDNILNLATENSCYDMSKRELIDAFMTEERVWKYEFYPSKVELIPEPDNPVDPNAIKVIVDDEHVGYIKSGSCAHLLKVINSDGIVNIDCTIGGGPYKYVSEYYDDEKDKDVYELERSSTNFFVHLEIMEH